MKPWPWKDLGLNDWVGRASKCSRSQRLRTMELLDAANTGTYGHPVPTNSRSDTGRARPSWSRATDLKDLEELLKQTEGKGIDIYTHGEMLPTRLPEAQSLCPFLRPLRNGLAEPAGNSPSFRAPSS